MNSYQWEQFPFCASVAAQFDQLSKMVVKMQIAMKMLHITECMQSVWTTEHFKGGIDQDAKVYIFELTQFVHFLNTWFVLNT